MCTYVGRAIQVDPQVYADYFKKSQLKKDSMREVTGWLFCSYLAVEIGGT